MQADEPLPPPPHAPPQAAPRGESTDRELLAHPARQSPIALIFIAWRFVRRLGVSALVAAVVFVTNGGLAVGALLLGVVATAALLVFSVISWWRFTFAVTGDEIVVTKGIASVERLVIPLDRVQSVAIDQRLAHRIVGLVRAAVDTAGSTDVEFEIDAIDRARAEALRRVAADARPVAAPQPGGSGALPPPRPPDVTILHRTVGDLVKVGLTRAPWAGLVALAPLIALGDEVGQLGGIGDRLERLFDRSGDGSAASVAVTIVVTIVLVTVIGAALQLIREVLTNWDLQLRRTATGLRRTAGLLSTTSRSSTARRVQMITTDESPLQRWLGFTHLRLHAFGDNDMSLPGSTPDEVQHVRSVVFGAPDLPHLDRGISRWWVFKVVRNLAVLAVLAAIALWFAVGWWSVLTLAAVPIRFGAAQRRWRLRRWGLTEERVAESYEFISRHTADVPLNKAQVVTVSQSFFERRKGLATVTVRTAGGYLAVPMIPASTANDVRDRMLYAVETGQCRFI